MLGPPHTAAEDEGGIGETGRARHDKESSRELPLDYWPLQAPGLDIRL
jgi:hypothetical protein